MLAQNPDDAELFDVFVRLRDRGFLPPAPLALPSGSPDAVAFALSHRTADEVAALAASIGAPPDPASPDARTIAEVWLAANDPRIDALLARFERDDFAEGLAEPGCPRMNWSILARLRLALARGAAPDISLDDLSEPARLEGLARLLSAALKQSDVHGAHWLVPVDGDRFVANLTLATLRRPALSAAFGDLVPRLLALLPTSTHPLAQAERLDLARRFDDANAHYATALEAADAKRVLAARDALLQGATTAWPPLVGAELLPETDLDRIIARSCLHAGGQPSASLAGSASRDVATSLAGSASRDVTTSLTPEANLATAAIRERLGDKSGAAKAYAELVVSPTARPAADPQHRISGQDLVAATEAVRLSAELSRETREALRLAITSSFTLDDEVTLVSPELARRAELAFRLDPDPIAASRLFAVRPAPTGTDTALPDSDPHHPAHRLAAASDLLAENRVEPAANILAALLKKAEPGTPERLFFVVATALEHDEPPDELLSAARKALYEQPQTGATSTLGGPPRAKRLLAALRKSPTAAFALHEELLGLAKDPSRPDPLRLSALECWLNIWAATTTPPNPDLLATLREAEPALIAAAATAIGAAEITGDPLEALGRFLAHTGPEVAGPAWADALLDLMLGR